MPADYVNKLARMFQDIKVSEDLNQSFKEMHKHNKLALPGGTFCCSLSTFLYPINMINYIDIDLIYIVRPEN